MKKDTNIFIEHILESIKDIESFTKGISKDKFFKNKEKQNAVVRSLEIIGEAVKNIPNSLKEKYSFISWREIAGTRDKIIQHYFGVDLDIIWDIVKKELPKLKDKLKKILKEEIKKKPVRNKN